MSENAAKPVSSVVEVVDHPDAQQFEARIDGELAGRLEYRREPGRIELLHTIVDPDFGGLGVGSALVRHCLDAIRAEDGTRAALVCPFTQGWVKKHPGYGDLVE